MAKQKGARIQSDSGNLELVTKEDNNPFPPADQLEKLNSFRPDLVDEVINLVKSEVEHRRALENTAQKVMQEELKCNRKVVVCISILCLLITAFLGYFGREMSAFASCLFPIFLLISRLIKR